MHEWFTGFGVSTFLSVLPILNPLEAIPVFVALTSGQPRAYRLQMAKETAIYVLAIMLVSLLAGRAVLSFFGVAVGHLQVAGGLLVGKTAWQMSTGSVSPPPSSAPGAGTPPDIAFSPMALPVLSGPGVIALLIATATRSDRPLDYVDAIGGLIVLAIVTYIALLAAGPISQRLGDKGIDAMTRVMGFIVLAIAVSFIADGTAALARMLGF